MSSHALRICVFGERIAAPPDEGIKKLTLSLAAAFRSLGHDVAVLTTAAPDWPEQGVVAVAADRLLRSQDLQKRLDAFRPDAVIYVPTASHTLASGMRSQTLGRYGRAPVCLVATQGRRHNPFVRIAAHFFRPDLCATFAARTSEQARSLGWPTAQLPPGVDLDHFRPVSLSEKAGLREHFGLPPGAFVVLHAGHLNRNRGVAELTALADIALPVLVASTSTVRDEALAEELRRGGVTVFTRFLPDIGRLYASADAYVFPVPPDPLAPSSIDVPLSVLEAAACDLPLVTTRFGALPELWPNARGVNYYQGRAELLAAVAALRAAAPCDGHTRALAEPFGWAVVARRLLDTLLGPRKRT